MKVSELAAKLNNQTETVEKIITEIQALKVALEDVDIPEEALAALNRLDDALTAADELNPDAPVDAV
jgi:chaperonin cofactor prefoldin